MGDLDVARQYDDEALRDVTEPRDRVAALYLGAWIASEQGDRRRERAMLDEALPLAEQLGGKQLVRVLSRFGRYEVEGGDFDAASAHVERARALAEQLHHPASSRQVLMQLATIAALSGDPEASLRYNLEALAIAEKMGDIEGQALAHGNIGVGRHLLGDAQGSIEEYRRALDHYQRANALNRQLGRALYEGNNIANIAQVHVRLGDDDAARERLREAFSMAVRTGSMATLLFCMLVEADRRLMVGETDRALELIALVHAHPAHTKENDDEIDRILSRVGLSADALARVSADRADAELAPAVSRIIEDLASGAP
jgi:tetratricopeptide (TPR) repeat protein